MTIYNAHIYSHLSYCLVVWESMLNAECRDKLYKAQKACIRTVAKLKPRDSLHGVFQALWTIPFPDLIQLELTKLSFKVSKNISQNLYWQFSMQMKEKKNINIKLGTKKFQTFKIIKVICLATVFCVEVYDNI